jgi:hypothetical protein
MPARKLRPNLVRGATETQLKLSIVDALQSRPTTSANLCYLLGAGSIEDRQRVNHTLSQMIDKEVFYFRVSSKSVFASRQWARRYG